jgi:putative methyltransferase (TIGR04325 family)
MSTDYRDRLATTLYGARLRGFARKHLPARTRSWARRARNLVISDLEYVPEGWARARHDPTIVPGDVNGASQLPGHLERWPAFVRAVEGAGPLGVNHELPVSADESPRTDELGAHNTVISFAYVLALAAVRKERLSILDWGGAIGQYYILARALIPDIDVEYSCKEATELCVHGRTLLPEATFYDDDACFERTYDLVVASGSLALSENWSEVLGELAEAADDYLYAARLPVVLRSPSFVVLQRAYSRGLNIASMQWALNREEFVEVAGRSGIELIREFLSCETTNVRRAPEQIASRHFLFRKVPRDREER